MAFPVFGKVAQSALALLRPSQRLRWTREGFVYIIVWLSLLAVGLWQQVNMVLLIAGLAAGPIIGSIFVSKGMLRGLWISRRGPRYVFSGEPLALVYTLKNDRRWVEALALVAEDVLEPVEPSSPRTTALYPQVFFPKVSGRDQSRETWRGVAPARGRYRFGFTDLVTRAPFGLLERRATYDDPGELIVYPEVGTLSRRWRLMHREATETRRGRRHDRSIQQQEYHGLRDYRPGDSPRWIHWRTTARLGVPMVKEFEQQHDQDLAILIDPWLPRTKATSEGREAVEQAIRFAATLCLETCRNQTRRLLLGWTGPLPGVRHGPASVKLLHELLEALALLRPTPEGQISALIDAMPPAILREAMLVIVSTRALNLAAEAERSSRLSEGAGLRLANRVIVLDASRGDLDDLLQFGASPLGTPAPAPAPVLDPSEAVSVNGRPAPVSKPGASETGPTQETRS
ncbi:DUF58 domain-containing protein [soil metagenome]